MKIAEQKLMLKNGQSCKIRSPEGKDAQQMIDFSVGLSHTTDYMLRYPEESVFALADEVELLDGKAAAERSCFIACFVDEQIIGNIGLYPVGDRLKLRHRCEIGIGVSAEYRGQGVGSILLKQAIACAETLGYEQMELDVVSENRAAIALYEKFGFHKVGQIPHGMKRREGGYYDLDYMVCSL